MGWKLNDRLGGSLGELKMIYLQLPSPDEGIIFYKIERFSVI